MERQLKKRPSRYGKIFWYAGAFLLPAMLMVLILWRGGFYPFGGRTMFIMDMRDQYLEFFASLRDIAGGDNSIFFAWSRSMGGNYLGLFAYYLASPLSFLTVLFPLEKLDLAIVVLTVLKIGLCGLSFAVYADYLWTRADKRARGTDSAGDANAAENRTGCGKGILVLLFSVCYALISYNMVYSLCLMWLDGVILLPVVLLGVEKILDGRKGIHYMLALAALFVCNYYTGYMIGIFTAIYLLYRLAGTVSTSTVRVCLMKGVRFAVCTVFAFGLSMPLILPVVRDLIQGKLSANNWRPDTTTNFAFTELFGKFKNGVYDSITNTGLPAVYCGFLVLALALLFFFCFKISAREKTGAALILVLFAMSFYFTDLDVAWHGFQYPNWFPYRYAFLFSFFLIYMALRTTIALRQGALAEVLKKRFGGRRVWLYAGYGFLAAALAATAWEMKNNGEALLQGLGNEFGYVTVEDYEAYLDRTKPLVEQIQKQDDGLYRINANFEFSKNDAMLLGYNGMTHYSSTFNEAVNSLTSKLGMAQSHIWNSGYGTNPLSDSLFAVSYKLSDCAEPACYELIADEGYGTAAYRNTLALPMVYAADLSTLEPDLSSSDPYENQNAFLNGIAGTDSAYFTEYSYTRQETAGSYGWSYTFVAQDDNPVYLFMQTYDGGWADVMVNDVRVGNYFSTETKCSLYLGSFAAGQQVTVRVEPQQQINVFEAEIAKLDMTALSGTLAQLRAGGMQTDYHRNASLKGRIRVKEGQTIVSSIPYDAGWTVKIDGKKVKPQKYAGTFLAVEAPAGEHSITFTYVSPGFRAGVWCCLITVALAVWYFQKTVDSF